ncbi:hypothetical protein DVH24_004433 [Malus domestica]|uniref:Uncharacterized protein n=1 Tax=Malus domestica TaxID=3750 RepID=A0A498IC17_MALDO|nr:hypothetical protein DVH24_004433 [Malus domestica]
MESLNLKCSESKRKTLTIKRIHHLQQTIFFATFHIANWFYGGTSISSWYQSELSSCEAKRPHALHVTQLLSTCRLENRPHVRGRVESCPTSMRNKVCYVLIWSWTTPYIVNHYMSSYRIIAYANAI